jgi:hypothetical protein
MESHVSTSETQDRKTGCEILCNILPEVWQIITLNPKPIPLGADGNQWIVIEVTR